MSKNDQVTNLKFLKLGKFNMPYFPGPVKFLLDKSLPTLVKLLGARLGLGKVEHHSVRLPEYKMKLKDGTYLATDVYVPKKVLKKKSKAPTILIRLPYYKDNFMYLGHIYASYGYVCVLQDIRGTAHSEGMNFILMAERNDGLQTLKWITKQFWYNKKIGMCGASYFGMTQYCISWDNDGLLTTICPAIASYTNMMKLNGGLGMNALLTDFKRILLKNTIYKDEPKHGFYTKEAIENYLNPKTALYNEPIFMNKPKLSHFKGLPLDFIVKMVKRMFKLKNFNLTERNYKYLIELVERLLDNIDVNIEKMFGMLDLEVEKMSQPAFILSGWYDLFLEHSLKDYLDIKANAKGVTQEQTRILIGPFAHAEIGAKTNTISNGMLDFVKNLLAIEWYDYWLKEKKKDFIDKPPIKYYVMGKYIWRFCNEWPPKNIELKKLYLHSNGNANSLHGNGSLSFKVPNSEKEDSYEFDPINPVLTKGGRNLFIRKGAHDQRDIEKRRDVLVYTSNILEEGIEITGQMKFLLYASSTAKDTDFMVKLVDVHPKGRAINIKDAGIRTRFRKGEKKPELIEPGKIIEYEINLGSTSIYIKPGHRIRIEITSSNFPRFDINSNMGGEGSNGDYMIAEQTIFHNHEYPSHLLIPIYK